MQLIKYKIVIKKSEYGYSSYGITFDRVGSWNFDNDFARNVVIFGVDNSSLSHGDNCKSKYLMLGEGPTYLINGNFGASEKKSSINFSKGNTKLCMYYYELEELEENTGWLMIMH